MEGKSSARIYSPDYLRVIACIMVIGIHCMGFVSSDGISTKYIVINHFVRIGLPIFFLLSSVAVNNRVEYINDLKSYYISKMLSLGIYFLIFSVYYYEYKNQTMSSLNEIVRNIPAGLLATLNGSQYYHLWYIYTFAGLTLWMPFLKVLLKNLKFEQHLILSIGCFLLSIANYYLNIPIGNQYTSWGIYYILGSLVLRKEFEKHYTGSVIAGFVAFVVSIFIEIKLPNSVYMTHIFDLGPLMIMQAIGVFVLAIKFNVFVSGCDFKVYSFVYRISTLTYLVYLCHPAVINCYKNSIIYHNISTIGSGIQLFIFSVLNVFIISVVVSIIFKICGHFIFLLFKMIHPMKI